LQNEHRNTSSLFFFKGASLSKRKWAETHV